MLESIYDVQMANELPGSPFCTSYFSPTGKLNHHAQSWSAQVMVGLTFHGLRISIHKKANLQFFMPPDCVSGPVYVFWPEYVNVYMSVGSYLLSEPLCPFLQLVSHFLLHFRHLSIQIARQT